MELPKIVYDDFYKFLMSAGIIILLIGFVADSYILFQFKNPEIFSNYFVLWVIVSLPYTGLVIAGFYLMLFAGKKWYVNQKYIDQKIKADAAIASHAAQNMIGLDDEIYKDLPKNSKTALVSFKISSVLPGTIFFDFLKDWKVWFWIANHETKKYRAYVKIRFISEHFEKEISEGYYGGTKAWNLNALSAIQAPGLEIPEELKKIAKQKHRIEIQINCEVKDENDKLIEIKLPQGYVYDYNNKSWFLEP